VLKHGPELKKLVIFHADASRMEWHRNRQSPPAPQGNCEVEFRWLEPGAWKRNPAVLETPADVVAARFSEAGRCLVGTDNRSRTVYHLWLMPAGTFVSWIGKVVRPPAAGMLVSDVWVDPSWRGGNVHRWGVSVMAGELVRHGRRIVTAGVEDHEFRAEATMFARLGLGLCVPAYCIYWLRAAGTWGIHWRSRPPRQLLQFSERLEEFCRSSGTLK
jgi:hypothetical protein